MDTALKVYSKAYDRSLYLIRLAFGITNHRKRRTRSDWASKFKKHIGWRARDIIERIDSKDALIVLRGKRYLKGKDFSALQISELYRSALVLLISAMDSYYHAKILSNITRVIKRGNPPKHLLNHKTQLSKLLTVVQGKKKNVSFIRSILEESLSYRSLQTPKEIAECINYIGIEDFWSKIAKKLKIEKKSVTSSLEKIVKRRNQIVHEGDTTTKGKYAAQPRRLLHKTVYNWCLFIDEIVKASDGLINDELRKKGS